MRVEALIDNWYEIQRNLSLEVVCIPIALRQELEKPKVNHLVAQLLDRGHLSIASNCDRPSRNPQLIPQSLFSL